MFNISPLEIMVIAVIALIVLGPARLPEVARSVGRGMREFRGALSGIAGDDEDEEDEVEDDDEVDDEIPPPPLPTEPPGDYQKDAESSESSSSSSGLV